MLTSQVTDAFSIDVTYQWLLFNGRKLEESSDLQAPEDILEDKLTEILFV